METQAVREVKNSFFTDHQANIHFHMTEKKNVLGFSHYNYIMRNDDNHNYARVAFLKFIETGDDVSVVCMNETISIATIIDEDDYNHSGAMKDFTIHLEAIGKAGRVMNTSVKCTLTNHNVTKSNTVPDVIITEDSYVDDNNKRRYGVGVWVNITNMRYVLTNVDKTFAANATPINSDHYPSAYIVEYLTDTTKKNDVNLLNIMNLSTVKKILEPKVSEHYIEGRLEELEKKTANEPHMFTQNTVLYDPNYKARSGEAETIQPTQIRRPSLDSVVKLDPVTKTFSVLKKGVYAIQLKNGFYLVQGESRLDLKVYKNSEELTEMNISAYLTSNPEGEDKDGKAIKNIYSSNVYVAEFDTDDKIKLTAAFMTDDEIVLENETMISVTALQYNVK